MIMRRLIWGLLLVMAASATESRYKSPDDLVLSADGKRLFVVCSGSDEVLAIDPATRSVVGRAKVGKVPRGIALAPDGKRLYVTNSWSDTVSEVDAASMQVLRTLPAGFEPTGLTVDAAHHSLYVANRLSDDISLIDLETGADVRRFAGGRGASYVTASPNGANIYVSHIYPQLGKFRTAPKSEITQLDATHQVVADRLCLNNVAGVFHIAFSKNGRLGIASLMRPKNLVPLAHVEHGWAFGNSLAVFGEDIGGVVQMPLDEIESYPSLLFGVAFSPDQKRIYVSASGSNEVLIVDVAKLVAAARSPKVARLANDLSASALYVVGRVGVGRNPRNIQVSPDGSALYVANRLDDTVSVVDTARAVVTTTIALGEATPLTAERRGERLFYSSMYSFGHQFGCANCHIDTTFDGLAWDLEPDGFGMDIVDNRALEQIKDTAPFKWNGANPDLQTECGPRVERYFFRSEGFRGDDLEDLVAYLKSIPLRPNRYRLPDGKLTPAQERGRAIFLRTSKKDGKPFPDVNQCSFCHSGKDYTNKLMAYVGSDKHTDRSPLVDVPGLTNVVNSAPYLHDGSAATLEEIWTVVIPQDKHGITSDLTKDDLNDLIEYLKTL
jgi:YVTN family beta-propeller protein